jgi:hypothetical protein
LAQLAEIVKMTGHHITFLVADDRYEHPASMVLANRCGPSLIESQARLTSLPQLHGGTLGHDPAIPGE